MLTEDLSIFFDPDELGTAATFNGSKAVNGIFRSPYVDFVDDVASTNPEFECALADVTSVANAIDKTLKIGSITYTIRNARPDTSGRTVHLELEQQGTL